jgi:hypothetical protein
MESARHAARPDSSLRTDTQYRIAEHSASASSELSD